MTDTRDSSPAAPAAPAALYVYDNGGAGGYACPACFAGYREAYESKTVRPTAQIGPVQVEIDPADLPAPEDFDAMTRWPEGAICDGCGAGGPEQVTTEDQREPRQEDDEPQPAPILPEEWPYIRAYRVRDLTEAGPCPVCGWPVDEGDYAFEITDDHAGEIFEAYEAGLCCRKCAEEARAELIAETQQAPR